MLTQMMVEAQRYLQHASETPSEMLAVLSVVIAAAFVLVSSFVKTMIPLRWLAIGSNIGFVGFGAIHPSYPMLLLHAALLPINVYRLAEMVRLTRRVRAAGVKADTSGIWLKPYMRSSRLRAGTVLFRQGDRGDRLYLLAEGRIELLEIAGDVVPGQIFGEIAFFSPDRRRRLSARCAEDSTVLSIDESTVRQLYFQNPAFGFKIIQLVAARFSSDVDRLNAELVKARAEAAAAGPAAAS